MMVHHSLTVTWILEDCGGLHTTALLPPTLRLHSPTVVEKGIIVRGLHTIFTCLFHVISHLSLVKLRDFKLSLHCRQVVGERGRRRTNGGAGWM